MGPSLVWPSSTLLEQGGSRENFMASPSILTTCRWWRPGRLTPLLVCKLAQKCRAFLTNHSYGMMCRPFLSLITITTSFIDNLLSSLDLTWF